MNSKPFAPVVDDPERVLPSRRDLRYRPLRHYGRWVAVGIAILLCAVVAYSVTTNPSFGWPTAFSFLFDPRILLGVVRAILLTIVCMIIGVALGTLLAVMRMSSIRFFNIIAIAYIWVFRSVPQLVQLILWYNLGALYQGFAYNIPFTEAIISVNVNDIISPLTAAILGLGLSQAGYTAEVIRGGIIGVDSGQQKAAMALGFKKTDTFFRIIAPQAIRIVIPPVGNEVISMLKNTSLLSVIAYPELFYSAQLIYARTYQVIPLLMTACIWYLAIVSVLTFLQQKVETHYGRGFAGVY